MSICIAMSSSQSLLFLLFFTLLSQTPTSLSLPNDGNKCGNVTVPFPFHLNNISSSFTAFYLSCSPNASSLHLSIDRKSYLVIDFFDDGLLVNFPDTSFSSSCRQYNDLNSFGFSSSENFAISQENVLGLYDCEDSSLCKAVCETNELPGCDNGISSLACCYPLSDQSAWRYGDGFGVFGKYGCRGFSSWVVSRGTNRGKRGVKLEWAVPRNLSADLCDKNAEVVNATAVEGGVRCLCQDGFAGDGFAGGVGCLKSCFKDGKEAYGAECYREKHDRKKLVILAGILAPALIVGSLFALFCLLKRPDKRGEFDTDRFHSTVSFHKASRTRLFSYRELEEATKGFAESQKLADGKNGTIYSGILQDGLRVAVHKVHCENQREFMEVSSQIEHLSGVFHRNLARVIGCCLDYGYTPLVVYEYPANGTLEDHLHLHQSTSKRYGFDWFKRLNISAETASVLAFLQFEIYPPIFHHNIKSGYVFLDEEFSARIAGFGLLNLDDQESNSYQNLQTHKSDVYDFGLLLLEIITGSKQLDTLPLALQKIKIGKIEEVVDPSLYYHEQPSYHREQIGIVADIATRCILFGGDGKFGMIDVARELVQGIGGAGKKGGALEETFSNSSLLQMISMSPDSIHLPKT